MLSIGTEPTATDQDAPPPAARRLRVVIVDEELPYPPISGKRIRTLNLLLRLARRHDIRFLCHRNADPTELRNAVEFFRDHGMTPVLSESVVPPKSVHGGVKFYARLAANLLSPRPYLVDVNNSPALRATAAAHARRHATDLWQVEWTPYVEVLRGLSARPQVIVAHNIESLIWQRYWETEAHPLKRWYIARQWHKFERFERQAFAACEQLVTVSPDDAALARERFGADRVAVVDNGVDTAYFQPAATARDPRHILFLGSLDWRPNLDGVRLLLEQVFPAVRQRVPGARLNVVGRNPPAWLETLARAVPGVQFSANVPDVRPHLAAAGVLAVPLRIGGGSRLKILEALAAGVPVVSTRVGAEGLALEPGRDLTVVEDVAAMTDALVAHAETPEVGTAQAANGRRKVLDHYDWDALADQLEQVWLEAAPAGQPSPSVGLRR